ncbi:MAG: hypothetical protein AAF629_34615 [Chloroflexota bacterium]
MINLVDNNKQLPNWLDRLLAPCMVFILWLLTIALGLIDIFAIWEALVLLTPFSSRPLLPWQDPVIFVLAVCLVVYVLWSSRIHLTHYKQPRSWRLFALTLGLELIILAITLILYFFAAS